jgi:hypothetical protein
MANPVQAFVNVNQTVGPVTQSGWATFTYAITAGYNAFIPVEFAMTGDFSFSPEVYVHRSTDGGNSFETQGSLYALIADDGLATDRTIRKDIELDTGWYQIRVMGGSHETQTFTISLTTAHVITAYA